MGKTIAKFSLHLIRMTHCSCITTKSFVPNTVPRNSGAFRSKRWKPASQEPNRRALCHWPMSSNRLHWGRPEHGAPKGMDGSQVSVRLSRLQTIYSESSVPGDRFLITLGPILSRCSQSLNESTFYHQDPQSLVELLNLLCDCDKLRKMLMRLLG